MGHPQRSDSLPPVLCAQESSGGNEDVGLSDLQVIRGEALQQLQEAQQEALAILEEATKVSDSLPSPAVPIASDSLAAVASGAVAAPSGVGSCHNPLLLKPVEASPLEIGSGSLAAFRKQLPKAFRRQAYRRESAAIKCNKAMTRVHEMSWKALADPIFSTCSGSFKS